MNFLKCAIYLAVVGITFFFLGRLIPKSWFHENRFPYKSFALERDGKLYESVKIQFWQDKVPDMSKVFPRLMPPKKITRNFRQELPRMIQETCVAEFIHVLLCFAGFFCMRLWKGLGGFLISLLFFIGNIPFIMIQRYNRPRFIRLLKKYQTATMRGIDTENENTDTELQHR